MGRATIRRPRLIFGTICAVLAILTTSAASRSDDAPPIGVPPPAAPVGPAGQEPASPAPPPARDESSPASPVGTTPRLQKIAFDRMEHDFGPVRQQETKSTRFTVRNTGGAPLHVSARGDCGCTAVAIVAKDSTSGDTGTPSREIAPGDEASIWVTFGSNRYVGQVTKWIRVTSDDPTNLAAVLTIKMDVAAGIMLEPQGFFFNMVLVGTSPEATIEAKWKEGVGKPFRITSIETTELQPLIAKPNFGIERFDAPPWHGYRLKLSFPDPPPVGFVTGQALILTDDPHDAKLQVFIAGTVSGKVVVSQRNPSFGMVRQGNGATLPIQVRGFDASVDVGHVRATSRKGCVHVSVRAGDDSWMKGIWNVEIEIPKDARLGTIDDVIDLTTEVKGEERIELTVGGVVIAK